jgi:branched-chain amino acid transport system substrate-binding protein
MSKSKHLTLVIVLLSTLILVACSDSSTPTTAITQPTTAPAATTALSAATTTQPTTVTTGLSSTTPANTSPLVIGMIVSRTGSLSVYGKMFEDSWPIALEYYTKGTNKINGREVKTVIEDDASDATKAVAAARKLVQQDKAEVLVGGMGSPAALALAPVLDKDLKKVLISDFAAAASITGSSFSRYTFRTGRNTDQDAVGDATLAVDIASKKNKKIVSFYQDYAYGQEGNSSLKEQVSKTPGITLSEIAVPLDATDFTSYVQKILDAAPDVVVLSWAGTSTPQLAQAMKDKGVFSKMAVVTAIIDFKVGIKSFGDAAVGFQGAAVYWPQF